MDCPVCSNAMLTLELEDVEIDHCIECGGIWLDSGELELLLGEPDKVRSLLDSFRVDSKCAEARRKCPICDKKMQKIIVGDTKAALRRESTGLLIDKCHKGDGLWFDKGELHEVFDKAKLDQDNKIQELLADMFGYDRD